MIAARRSLPFLSFFRLDPSENPTVRPPRERLEALGGVPGEEGLIIVARTLPFERGLIVVGRQRRPRPGARRRPRT
jgi:hypothetical protein